MDSKFLNIILALLTIAFSIGASYAITQHQVSANTSQLIINTAKINVNENENIAHSTQLGYVIKIVERIEEKIDNVH